MRIFGYCTGCHRFKHVRVSSAGMVSLATSKVAQGICHDCEEEEDGRGGS